MVRQRKVKSGLMMSLAQSALNSNYCEAIGMFENLSVAKRKDNKRFEKEWLMQNRLDA